MSGNERWISLIIISHRGFWKYDYEKNTSLAFERSFSEGFGTETDVRDMNGRLVISHDIPTNDSMDLEKFLQLYSSKNIKVPLALNIKADGLRNLLKSALEKFGIKNYFVFDMSLPEQILYINQGFRTFTRQSEYEKDPLLYKESTGVWLDCFKDDWVDEKVIESHLNNDKIVALVSPDLHKRDHKVFWNKLKNMPIYKNDKLILCTDLPNEARGFFYGKN